MAGMQAWDVCLRGRLIDTVFYNKRCDGGALITAEDVRRSLIDHDGYDPAIVVNAVAKPSVCRLAAVGKHEGLRLSVRRVSRYRRGVEVSEVMEQFRKVYRIGTARSWGGRAYSVYVKTEYKDGRLSLSGVEGPTHDGNAIGSCGQIIMDLNLDELTPAPGWTRKKLERLLAIWRTWHLNDMKAGCEHQREKWDTSAEVMLVDFGCTHEFHELARKASAGNLTAQEYEEYGRLVARVDAVTVATDRPKYETEEVKDLIIHGWIAPGRTEKKTVGWVHPYEHPEGLLCKPCEVCGYKYGTAWLKVEVPDEVLQELKDFPDTDRTPAWV